MSNKQSKSVWDPTVEVETNRHYWEGTDFKINKRPPSHSEKPKVVELFSGCGGTSLGFEMAGFETILGADIHEPSIETFHWNHKKATSVLGDLRKMSGKEFQKLLDVYNKIDVMIAGVPCQGFSINNRKRYSKDKRNYLFLEFLRLSSIVKPKIVLIENVSGLKSTDNGSFEKAIKNKIREIGYRNVENRILNAADYGVPQNRKRLFFIGWNKDHKFTWPNPTNGIEGKPYLTVKDAIWDLPFIEPSGKSDSYNKKPITSYQKLMRKNSDTIYNHKAPRHPNTTINRIKNTKPDDTMYKKFKQRIRMH